MKNEVENTTEHVKLPGMRNLLMATPEEIVASEARGQRQLVRSDVLPVEGLMEIESELIDLGFELGELVAGDPLFRLASLPDGWKKVPADHSLWTAIIDGQGRERFAIFYKAAFYDRRAFIRKTYSPEEGSGKTDDGGKNEPATD